MNEEEKEKAIELIKSMGVDAPYMDFDWQYTCVLDGRFSLEPLTELFKKCAYFKNGVCGIRVCGISGESNFLNLNEEEKDRERIINCLNPFDDCDFSNGAEVAKAEIECSKRIAKALTQAKQEAYKEMEAKLAKYQDVSSIVGKIRAAHTPDDVLEVVAMKNKIAELEKQNTILHGMINELETKLERRETKC